MFSILLDLDGTLAFLNVPVYAQVCNEVLELDIAPEVLATVKRLADFHALAEIGQRSVAVGAEKFAYQLAWLKFHPRTLAHSLIAPGSVEGAHKLLSLCGDRLGYCTARYSSDCEQHQSIEIATRQWLAGQRFPSPANVSFCDRYSGKLQHMLQLASEEGAQVILIDDGYQHLLDRAASELASSALTLLQQRLTLVAYGVQVAPEHTHGIQTIALQRWRDVDILLKMLGETHGLPTL